MPARVTTAGDSTASVPDIGSPRLVGRETEIGQITAALARPPAVVLVEGEAGIGKTRLVREFLAVQPARERKVLVAACPPFRQPYTLGPVVDALRQAAGSVAGLRLSALAGALRPLFPAWAAALPDPPEPLEDAAAARHRLFSALAELLDRLGFGVLVAEDVHWADDATLEFLLFLACRQSGRVSLVVTCRPEDVPGSSLLPRLARLAAGSGGRRLILEPLDMAETAAMVSSMLGGEPLSEEFAEFVHQRTEGVPLAVEESVRLMGERAYLARRSGRWLRRDVGEIDVPPTVRDSVLERVGRLGADAQAVLQAAAVLAAPATEAMLAAVAGLPPDQARAGVCEAMGCGLLTDDMKTNAIPYEGALIFRHMLASRAVYESIPSPRRRELHLRAGRALERDVPPPLARLARHFRAAGQTREWCRYAEQAADLALATGDEATAADLLFELITQADLPGPELIRLIRKTRFTTAADSGRYRDQVNVLRAVLDAGDLEPGAEAEARFQLGRVLMAMENYSAGRAEVERAAPHLGHDPDLAARAMITLGWAHAADCHASVHLRWLRQAAGAAGPLAAADRLRLTVDRVSGLLLLGEEEGWAEADLLRGDARDARERVQITRGHLNIGEMAMLWGRYGEAQDRFTAALELADAHQYTRYRNVASADQVRLDWLTGAWHGLAERASRLTAEDRIQPRQRLDAILVAGLLHAATGAYQEAEPRLRHVIDEARQRGAVEYTMDPAGALARLRLAEGRPADALEMTDEPAALVARKGIWLWATEIAPARVQALAAAGRAREAAELVAAFAQGLRGRNAPAPGAALATCRAVLAKARGQHARAAALFGRAAAAWQVLPRPYDALLAREGQAGCLLAAGQAESALAMLSGLRQQLIALGALGDADRVVLMLREHGVAAKRPQRGGRRVYGDRLSPREMEVVRLLTQGQTDREIAASLFVTPKTVACHLDSARRKLKAPSRTALVAAAVTAGIMAQP